MLQLVFSAQPVNQLLTKAVEAGLSSEEVDKVMMYCAAFYGNTGNYKSFGDTKFVPDVSKSQFEIFLLAGSADQTAVTVMWEECCERMFSLPPRQRQIGLGAANGISTYFSANCEEADAEIAGRFLDSVGLSPYNTRLFKSADGVYTVRLASATALADGADPIAELCKEHR